MNASTPEPGWKRLSKSHSISRALNTEGLQSARGNHKRRKPINDYVYCEDRE